MCRYGLGELQRAVAVRRAALQVGRVRRLGQWRWRARWCGVNFRWAQSRCHCANNYFASNSRLPADISNVIQSLSHRFNTAKMGVAERALPLALTIFCGIVGGTGEDNFPGGALLRNSAGYYTFQPVLAPKDTALGNAQPKT